MTSNVTSQTNKMKSAFSGVAKLVAGLTIAKSLFNIGKSAISMASNLQEVQNIVDVAFGSMAWKAEQFAKTAITQFGMSELSAKKTASTYMSMAKSAQINEAAASDMAITLAGLTGDVASFFNISQELADVRLKSVFTGETETLKELGVVMTQTNLEAFALSQGITKNISDMSQAEQTTLRYNFVLERLAFTQGDFSRTSGSWANQVRILQEQWKQLLGIIGNGLVAVLAPVIRVINIIIGKVITFANVLAGVFGKLFGKKADTGQSAFSGVPSAVDSGTDAIGGYNDALDKTGTQAKKTAKEIEGSLAGFDELNVIKTGSDSGDSGGSGGGAGGGSAGGFAVDPIDWGNTFKEPDTSGVDAAVEKVMGYIDKLKNFLNTNGAVIVALIAGMVAGFAAFQILTKWGTIIGAVTGPIAALKTWIGILGLAFAEASGPVSFLSALFGSTLGPIIAISAGIAAVTAAIVYLYETSAPFQELVNMAITSLMEILTLFWTTVLQPLFAFVGDFLATILVPLATFLASVFVEAVDFVMSILLSLWNNVLAPIAKFIVDVFSKALEGVIEIWEAWKPTIETIFEALMWLWDNVLKPIVEFIKEKLIKTIEEWGRVVSERVDDILKIFEGLIDFFVGIFTGDLDLAWEGIKKIFSGFQDFLRHIFETNWIDSFGILGGLLNGLLVSVSEIFDGIWGIFSGLIDFITGVFTGDWEQAWTGIVSIFEGIFQTIAGIAKAPINAVIGIINGAIGMINGIGFTVPGWVPIWGGQDFSPNIPEIPYLASGGVLNKATLAIAGEAGPEAVIPLSRNTKGIELIANRLLENMPAVSGNGGTYVIQLVLQDGTILAKTVIKSIKDYEVMTGKPAF